MRGAGSRRQDDSERRRGVCAPAAPQFIESTRACTRSAMPECATPIRASASDDIVSSSETARFCISCTFVMFVRPVPVRREPRSSKKFCIGSNNRSGMSLPADTHAQALCHWQTVAVNDCQAREGLMRCGWPLKWPAQERAEALESAQDRNGLRVAGLPHGLPSDGKNRGC